MTDTILYIALVAGVAGLLLAVYFTRVVLAAPQGNERMIELSTAIRAGAMAFLRRDYIWVSVFVVVMAVLTRPGLHCAPEVHRLLGTETTGALRFSLGWSSTERDVERAVAAVGAILRGTPVPSAERGIA